MKGFGTALLFSVAVAQEFPTHTNQSLSGSFGYGYNVGNSYLHGDSHGHNMGHQNVAGLGEQVPIAGFAYTADQATDHVFGYDTVQPLDEADWTAYLNTVGSTQATDALKANDVKVAIDAAITAANASRIAAIDDVLERRKNRLSEIHADHIFKVIAPFDLQIDLLDEEIADVTAAQTLATAHADDYFADLAGI